jgi:hypothetical protein
MKLLQRIGRGLVCLHRSNALNSGLCSGDGGAGGNAAKMPSSEWLQLNG